MSHWVLKYWIFQYDPKRQGYSPAGGGYTCSEVQALRYCEGHDDLAVYRYDHAGNAPLLIPSPKLANGSFLDDLRAPLGRPSQGRSYRLQASITPEQGAWLEVQIDKGRGEKSVSDVVSRLVKEAMEK